VVRGLSHVRAIARLPGFWRASALALAFTTLSVLHYAEQIGLPGAVSPDVDLGLTRHVLDRALFLVCVAYASFVFGIRGGSVAMAAALAVMLPRAILIDPLPRDSVAVTLIVGFIGGLTAVWFEGQLRQERRRAGLIDALQTTQLELGSQVEAARESEKRLAALNAIASIANRSLQLQRVLEDVVDKVMEVMEADVAFMFRVDEHRGDLVLEVHRGVSDSFAAQLSRMKIGEGLNGRVAAEGKGMVVPDASSDPRLTRQVVREEGIRSTLIAPIKYHGEVVGTASVGARQARNFTPEDVAFLTTIGDEIGIAIGNARLYEEQLRTAEQLRTSEENYRELFENARDAIWVQDVDGAILAANRECVELTGYGKEELVGMQAADLLPQNPEALKARTRLLAGQTVDRPYEQALRRKDGREVVLQLSVSLITSEYGDVNRPLAFQCIARDVTEERRLHNNLRHYRRQVTTAQEEERKRIARDLHDETAQGLVALSQRLDSLAAGPRGLDQDSRRSLEGLQEQVDKLLGEVRRFSRELRPSVLDHLGLVPALEGLGSEIAEWQGIDIDTKAKGVVRRLSPEVELGLFRIAQEALHNVHKHAEASLVEILLEFAPDSVKVTVRDNGKGFDVPERIADLPVSGRLGLVGMQERADLLEGTFRPESRPGEGTTISVEVAA